MEPYCIAAQRMPPGPSDMGPYCTGTQLIVTSGGQDWRPVQTFSLEEPPTPTTNSYEGCERSNKYKIPFMVRSHWQRPGPRQRSRPIKWIWNPLTSVTVSVSVSMNNSTHIYTTHFYRSWSLVFGLFKCEHTLWWAWYFALSYFLPNYENNMKWKTNGPQSERRGKTCPEGKAKKIHRSWAHQKRKTIYNIVSKWPIISWSQENRDIFIFRCQIDCRCLSFRRLEQVDVKKHTDCESFSFKAICFGQQMRHFLLLFSSSNNKCQLSGRQDITHRRL